MDQRTHFEQSLGLVMSTGIASHMLRVHKQIRTTRTPCASLDDDTASTALTATTTFFPIIAKERPPPPPQDNTNDGTLKASIFATLKVRHPTRNITTVKFSKWIPL